MVIFPLFFLTFVGLWAFSLVFWILKIVEVARISDYQYRAAHTEKTTWVLTVVGRQPLDVGRAGDCGRIRPRAGASGRST